ncbi:hypothetical protein GGI20_001333 [Coemansia sp. BCRC 34301]|nr:hypothetical protein GGI20_001333 [Coemansia sp. BCRC 34301]
MQYHYYHQPPPQNGMNTYHQHTVHPPPHLPAPQLYSVPRMGHSGDINSKLGQSGSVGSLGLGGSGRPLTAEEKEIKRKVSHSAIEKRRRERTNAVLRELQDIVPGLSKPGKIQKLEILEAAADYIRQLTTSAPESLAVSAARAKQRRNSRHYHRAFFPQDSPILGDYGAASRLGSLPDGAVERPALLSSKTIDEQHLTVTTPASVSSTASNNDDADEGDDDDSADDGTALVESTDACRGSELPPPSDPASMKVTFLLC